MYKICKTIVYVGYTIHIYIYTQYTHTSKYSSKHRRGKDSSTQPVPYKGAYYSTQY